MTDNVKVLADGLGMGESVRWHDERTWLCDWGAGKLLAIGDGGDRETVEGLGDVIPWTVDWLADGTMLIVPRGKSSLMRVSRTGTVSVHTELGEVAPQGCNEMVADGRGNIYLNTIGYDMMAGEAPRTGTVILVSADGSVRQVANDVHFPNGMAVTSDGSTLVLAESHANRLTAFTIEPDGSLSGRRVWADLGRGTPDGICMDREDAVWYAPAGPDRRNLHIAATIWQGAETYTADPPTGRLLSITDPRYRFCAPQPSGCRERVAAGEGDEFGLEIRVVGDGHAGAVVAAGPKDLVDGLHPFVHAGDQGGV